MSEIFYKQNLIDKIHRHSNFIEYQEDILRWKSELAQIESQELINTIAERYEKMFNLDAEDFDKLHQFEVKRKNQLDFLCNELKSIQEDKLLNYFTDESKENLRKLLKNVEYLINLEFEQEYVKCTKLFAKY